MKAPPPPPIYGARKCKQQYIHQPSETAPEESRLLSKQNYWLSLGETHHTPLVIGLEQCLEQTTPRAITARQEQYARKTTSDITQVPLCMSFTVVARCFFRVREDIEAPLEVAWVQSRTLNVQHFIPRDFL